MEAQDILRVADYDIVNLLRQESLPRQSNRWRTVNASCVLRIQAFILSSHRARVLNGIPLDMPVISLSDLDQEFLVPWHISLALRRKLMSLFLAQLELFRHANLICITVIQQIDPEETVNEFKVFYGQ
jgi:hypothetical protein